MKLPFLADDMPVMGKKIHFLHMSLLSWAKKPVSDGSVPAVMAPVLRRTESPTVGT
jgi:hypothetical protein